jgi:hypothetical protein
LAGNPNQHFKADLTRILQQKTDKMVTDKLQGVTRNLYKNLLFTSVHPGNTQKGYSQGSFVLSHRIGINQIDTSTTIVSEVVADAVKQAEKQMAMIQKIKAGDIVYISNSVLWAPNVEYGGWDSKSGNRTPPYNSFKLAAALSKIQIKGD